MIPCDLHLYSIDLTLGNPLEILAFAVDWVSLVLEDVDLVAADRSFGPGGSPVLFDLLDAMDGAAADADLLFVLTTNRADLLEPALAARPGRVDVAVEGTHDGIAGYVFDLGCETEDTGIEQAAIEVILVEGAWLVNTLSYGAEGTVTVPGADQG